MGSCPSLGWQQRLFLGHLATGCPQRKCSGNSKHQVPLGSSTRTNLALGPNQCLARWSHARAEWEFKQPGETTLRIGAVRTLPCWMPYSSLPTLKLKIPVLLIYGFQLRKTGRFRLKARLQIRQVKLQLPGQP